MRNIEYSLARARRVRPRRPAFGGYSLLLCAGLAFIFVAPDEGRNRGATSTAAIEVAPAQASVPAPPHRHVALPSDRVMTTSAEALGGVQAPDVWSTPLATGDAATDRDGGETARADGEIGADEAVPVLETASVREAAPPIAPALAAPSSEPEPTMPSVLFEHASLIDRPVAAEGSPSAARLDPTVPAATLRSLAGKWAAHRSACTDRGKKSAFLPLTLDERGARAGGATCSFRRTAQTGSGWSVAATCTDETETWNANVRLVLAGRKLTWSSERGSQTYSRCP